MDHTNTTNMVVESQKTTKETLRNEVVSSDVLEKVESLCLESKSKSSVVGTDEHCLTSEYPSAQRASQVFWETGTFERKIPSGFYSIIADRFLRDKYSVIPTLEDLRSFGQDGTRAYAILVDFEKDIKLSKLKEFVIAAVKGSSSNLPLMIRKIAEVVSDFYGGTLSEVSATKHFLGEISSTANNVGIQLLGKIKHGLCQPRAMLFKVLADAIGLECKLLVGLRVDDRVVLQTDPDKHISLLVMHNSTEILVDLLRSPGQLIPFSARALILYHFSGGVESDSADNDSCDSPLEPSSPLFPLSDRKHAESPVQGDQSCRISNDGKCEHNFPQSGPTSKQRRAFLVDNIISASRSEPDIAKFFLHRNRRRFIGDTRTGNSSLEQPSESMWVQRRHKLEGVRSFPSSPEHPLLKSRSRSTLGGQRQISRDDIDSTSASRQMDMGRSVIRENCHMESTEDDWTKIASTGMKEDNTKASESAMRAENDLNKTKCTSSHNLGQPQLQSHSSVIQRNHVQSSTISTSKDMSRNSDICKPSLPFTEWNIDPSELRSGVRVGIGSFGEVYRGVWKGTDVAIKILLEQDLTAENMEDFYNEISVLCRLRHPNVILFLGACTRPPHLSLVTEYMHLGSLYHLIHTSGQGNKLSWRRRLKMLLDICRGMMCIQRMNVVHRDLKSANCLVDKHWRVKICDFGLSRIMVDVPIKDLKAAGTPEWMAPELLRNEPFTDKCDIFSFGVIMWELTTLKRPWVGVKPMKVVYAVGHEGARLDIPEGPIGKLISDCWAEDPNSRPGYEDIFTRLHECEFSMS
eukprot:TRINITY_DN2967_c0_g1_i2.p1 TRINITY_DN2967_c0_g1~~TRINITY_DN2967_c0_g1_i2.p1  ORF type:complete len:803 (+),score=144.44 TRINITY_DN2967_c0_g1_i2:233-2641(+)